MLDLLELIRQDVEIKFKGTGAHGKEYCSPCPKCGGKDRFTIQPDSERTSKYWCRGCGAKGDLVQYLRDFRGLNYPDAYEAATGEKLPDNTGKKKFLPVEKPIVKPFSLLDLANVNISESSIRLYHECGFSKACEYYLQFEILPDTIRKFQIGHISADNKDGHYEGFTIPHFATGENNLQYVKGVKIRLENRFEKTHGRYLAIATSATGGVWNDKWSTSPDGSRKGLILPYLFCVESEKDCMLLDQEGFPAVAYKSKGGWDEYLPVVFKNSAHVIYIADRDENHEGEKTAIKFKENLKSHPCTIIMPNGFKDITDMSKAQSSVSVVKWLKERLPFIYRMECP